jgi:hypothetical protein
MSGGVGNPPGAVGVRFGLTVAPVFED